MFMMTISAIRARFHRLLKKIGLRETLRATMDCDAAPYLEIVNDEYHYVVNERGAELVRRRTTDPDEVLYWFISNVISDIAGEYELTHRIEGVDSRRLWFAKEIEWLAQINEEWGRRKQKEFETILKDHPYNDIPGRIVDRTQL